jgi:hypothetical protein
MKLAGWLKYVKLEKESGTQFLLKHSVSIFKAEDGDVCFSETLAPSDESTERQNPEEECHQGDVHMPSVLLCLLWPVFQNILYLRCDLFLYSAIEI